MTVMFENPLLSLFLFLIDSGKHFSRFRFCFKIFTFRFFVGYLVLKLLSYWLICYTLRKPGNSRSLNLRGQFHFFLTPPRPEGKENWLVPGR